MSFSSRLPSRNVFNGTPEKRQKLQHVECTSGLAFARPCSPEFLREFNGSSEIVDSKTSTPPALPPDIAIQCENISFSGNSTTSPRKSPMYHNSTAETEGGIVSGMDQSTEGNHQSCDANNPTLRTVNATEEGLVCFGMVTNLSVSLFSPLQNQAPSITNISYDPSTNRVSSKANKKAIGHVADQLTRELLDALHQEKDLELQLQLRIHSTAPEQSLGRSRIAKASTDIHMVAIVYGPTQLSEDVSEFFQHNNCYLQEPRGCDRNVPYRNPHCISSIDQEAPLTFDLEQLQGDYEQTPIPTDLLTRLETDEVLSEAQDPPGLKTSLYIHQKQALSFMMRREKGWAFTTPMGDVWSVEISQCGTTQYVNNITGNRQPNAPPSFRGGLLADDMGLGKTLTMIALIAYDHHRIQGQGPMNSVSEPLTNMAGGAFEASQYLSVWRCERKLLPTTATLLVVPSSLLQQWQMQLNQHLQSDGPAAVRWTMHHGKSRLKSQGQIDKYSIIMTSFQTLASDYRKTTRSLLFTTYWHRIVLDEAHSIRNWRSSTSRAVFDLEGASRWAISATLIQNRLSDICSVLQFLRVYPYCSRRIFNEEIIDLWKLGHEHIAFERLKHLFKFISIRRSQAILNLPKRTDLIRYLRFDDAESAVYEGLEKPIASMIEEDLANEDSAYEHYMHALVKINMLRKFCNLGLWAQELRRKEINTNHCNRDAWSISDKRAFLEDLMSSGQGACSVCNSNISWAMEANQSQRNDHASAFMSNCCRLICLTCYDHRHTVDSPQLAICTDHPPCEMMSVALTDLSFEISHPIMSLSTKVKELKKELLQHSDERCVVFSSWTTTLDMVQSMLDMSGIKYARIDGKVAFKDRASALATFQTGSSSQVMLLSIYCGAEGLNITADSRVYLMEPQWNPTIEAQALARVHRLGQTRNVTTIRFVMEDSIESHVINLQDRKKHLGDLVLSQRKGALGTASSSLQHLRSLLK